MKANSPTLSIVIPAYNEATYIDRLLEDLTKQNFKDFEVIVSDAESKDGTAEIVAQFGKSLDVKFVEAPPKGPAYGRNIGAKQAKGDWLLFLDADVDIDDPDFIKTLLGEAVKNDWSTSSAKMRVKKSESIKNRLGTSTFYRYQKLLAHTKHPVAQGYCILTKRLVFEKNKGFNEKIRLGEDNDYVSRVGRKYGFGFVDETYYYVDLRRTHNEGFKYAYKAMANEVYRHTHGYNLEKNRYAYDFGKHPKRKSK